MLIRDATADDWAGIWPILKHVFTSGETFVWDTDTTAEQAYAKWMQAPPGRTVVAVDDAGLIVGSAETHPNQRGPGSHVANAGFIVDPDRGGEGIGRALGEHVLAQAKADGYRAMQFNAVVENNVRAVALWKSLGFEILTTVPEAFEHPTDGFVGLHIMHRWL